MKLPQTTFVTTAMKLEECPDFGRIEYAVVGRSNVGKSSLINALASQKTLARVSKTPGRTQGINYFDFGPFMLADLPGYGYAKVSQTIQARWRKELSRYLSGRTALQGVIHLMDARRPLQDNDRQMREFLLEHGVPLVIVLTKVDEVKQAELAKAIKFVEQETDQLPIPFSSRSGRGKRELLRALIHEAPDGEHEEADEEVEGEDAIEEPLDD